jgi:hypothetical protein
MAAKTWSAALGLAAWVGLDWAIDKHAITLKDIDSMQRERCELGNTPEAIELWAADLAQRFGGRRLFDRFFGLAGSRWGNGGALAGRPIHGLRI